MRALILPGVLRPPSDSRLLATTMRDQAVARGATVLDVFTGSGVLAIAAALDGASSVTATDVSRRALVNARLNARLNRVPLRTLHGDLFEPVGDQRFDLILANPPYVPSASDELPRAGAARAWEGGRGGRALIDRLCSEVAGHLEPAGNLLMAHSSLSGEGATLSALETGGLQTEVVARHRGPLGPVTAARAELLERRGLLDPGQREEEILVIRGRLPAT